MRLFRTSVLSAAFVMSNAVVQAAPAVSAPVDIGTRKLVPSIRRNDTPIAIATTPTGLTLIVWTCSWVLGENFYAAPACGGVIGTLVTPSGALVGEPFAIPSPVTAATFDGTAFVLVGTDSNVTLTTPKSGSPILTHVTTDGVVSAGQSMDTTAALIDGIAIACAPTGCFAVWGETDGEASAYDIFGASIAIDGTIGARVHVSNAANDQRQPSVAFDGTEFMAAWLDDRFGEQIYGARIGTDGVVKDPIGFPAVTQTELVGTPSGFNQYTPPGPTVTATAGTTFVVWVGPDGPSARRFLGTSSLDSTPLALGFVSSMPAESPFFVASTPNGAFAAFGTQALVVPPTGPAPTPSTVATHPLWTAAAMPDGLIAAYIDGTTSADVYVVRVDATAAAPPPTYVSPVLEDTFPLFLEPGTSALAGYADWPNPSQNNGVARATALDVAGHAFSPDGLTESLPVALFLTMASGASKHLAIFDPGDQTSNHDLVGVLLNDDGSVSGAPIPIATQPYPETNPNVGFDGENFVVEWSDQGNGYVMPVVRRLAPDGTWVDDAFIPFVPDPNATHGSDIAAFGCHPGGCLAGVYGESGTENGFVTGSDTPTLSFADGKVTATGNDLWAGQGGKILREQGLLAGAPDVFLLVFFDPYSSAPQARRLDSAGLPLDAAPFTVYPVAAGPSAHPGSSLLVGATWTGSSWLALWSQELPTPQFLAARVGSTGTPLDDQPFIVDDGTHDTTLVLESFRPTPVLLASDADERAFVGYAFQDRMMVRVIAIDGNLPTEGGGGSAGNGGQSASGGSTGSGSAGTTSGGSPNTSGGSGGSSNTTGGSSNTTGGSGGSSTTNTSGGSAAISHAGSSSTATSGHDGAHPSVTAGASDDAAPPSSGGCNASANDAADGFFGVALALVALGRKRRRWTRRSV